MNKKQLLQLIGSLFVAVIFVASYTSMSTNPLPSQSKTSTTIVQTIYSYAFANAVVTGYASTATVAIGCNATVQASIGSKISSILTLLRKNNSVSNYYSPSSNMTLVYLGNMNMSKFYRYVSNYIGANDMACTSVQTDAEVLLPTTMNFYIQSQPYPIVIPSNLRAQRVPVSMHGNMSNMLKLKVYALVTVSGNIYGNMSILVV
jgi:hypothetical protein